MAISNGGGQFKTFGPFWDGTNSKAFQSIYVFAFAAGTTTPKNFWTDEDKTTAVTSRQGGLNGIVEGFFDGAYKIEIRESDGTTVIDTFDNFKITADTATMWEGNAGTAAPSATTANRWQLFALHDASNNFSDLLINLGASFVSLLRDEVNASWFSTFNAAITAIGSSTKTLVVSNSQAVTASVTVPSNITLVFTGDNGSLNISSAQTVTINGPIQPTMRKIFDGAGTVVFGVGFIREVYPQWWNTDVADDSTDATTAIQAAINSLPSGQGVVVFIRGVYRISSVNLASKTAVTLKGLGGKFDTSFRWTSTTGNVVDMTGARFIRFSNLNFLPLNPKTAGAVFLLDNADDNIFEDLRISSGLIAFDVLNGSSNDVWRDISLLDLTTDAWNTGFRFTGANSSMYMRSVIMSTGQVTTNAFVSLLESGATAIDTFVMERCGAQKTGTGVLPGLVIDGGEFIHIKSSHFEGGSTSAVGIKITGGTNINLVDTHSSTNSKGLQITGGNGITVTGGRYYFNDLEGIDIDGGKNIYIGGGVKILDNSNGTTNTSDGINVAAGVSDFHIIGTTIGRVRGGTTPQHRYGIRIEPGVSTRYVLSNNLISEFGTGTIFDGGTGASGAQKAISSNSGDVEEYLQASHFGSTVGAVTADLWTKTLDDETAYYLRAVVLAQGSSGTTRAAYTRTALVYRDGGGSATIEGAVSSLDSIESLAGYDATFVVSGNDVILRVTGNTGQTNRWVANVQIISRLSGA